MFLYDSIYVLDFLVVLPSCHQFVDLPCIDLIGRLFHQLSFVVVVILVLVLLTMVFCSIVLVYLLVYMYYSFSILFFPIFLANSSSSSHSLSCLIVSLINCCNDRCSKVLPEGPELLKFLIDCSNISNSSLSDLFFAASLSSGFSIINSINLGLSTSLHCLS